MSRRSMQYLTPFVAVIALALSACASTGSVTEPDEQTAATPQAVADGRPGHDGRFGPPRGHELFMVALHDLDLSAEQRKTIEGTLEKLRNEDHGAMMAFHKALADGVRAGNIDDNALNAKAAELEKQATAHREALSNALQTLHATLTPEQRQALVAQIEEHKGEHFGRKGKMHHKGHGPGDARRGHGPDGAREARGPEGMGPGMRGPMGFMLRDLNLTDEQQNKISAALDASMPDKPSREEMMQKHDEMRARGQAVLDAFKADKFDANAALPQKMGEPPFNHLITAMKAVVPVLDATQRATLADRLEQGPPKGPFGRHGRHRGGQSPETQ